MTIEIRKRDNPDALRQFWQVEVTAGSIVISRGVVGKLHDDTEFLLNKDDALVAFEGLCWALRDMGVTPQEVAERLAVLIQQEDGV